MKLTKLALVAALNAIVAVSTGLGQQPIQADGSAIQQVGCTESSCESGCTEMICDDDCSSGGGGSFRLRHGFDIGFGRGVRNYSRSLGSRVWDTVGPRGLCEDACCEPAWSLCEPACDSDPKFGGWLQAGYHSRGVSGRDTSPSRFNNNQDELQIHQSWLFAEKKAVSKCGRCGWGYRIDSVIGTDGPDTQAFGGNNDHWDNDWDIGSDYGVAIPQLYAELAYYDLSVKLGHFYTIIGYEVVQAPQNFFYSHAWTMVNSEPFTHTGFLASYEMSDDLTLYGGYSFGWDTGFNNNGDNFIGGFSLDINESTTLAITAAIGRIDETGVGPLAAEVGQMFSAVVTRQLSDDVTYVFQCDWLDTNTAGNNTAEFRRTIGINQYLMYQLNCNWAAGTRFEWWQADGPRWADVNGNAASSANIFDWTVGLNYRHNGNFIVRPEIRWTSDTDRLGANQGFDSDQIALGCDSIFTF